MKIRENLIIMLMVFFAGIVIGRLIHTSPDVSKYKLVDLGPAPTSKKVKSFEDIPATTAVKPVSIESFKEISGMTIRQAAAFLQTQGATPEQVAAFFQTQEAKKSAVATPQKPQKAESLYAGIFIGLCALCSLGLIFFLCHKTAKETILYSKSFLSFLARWAKQNRLHFSILYILSALICLGWLIFGVIMAIHIRPTDIGDFFVLALLSLICVVSLWIMYFAVYGFIKLICHKIICLWIGIVVFIIMGFFPPWMNQGNSFRGYGFLLDPPSFLRIDTTVLYAQWIMVAVITGGLLLTFQGKKKD